ncbi:MAG: lysylphosphatidylglycerol synthase domain-containing protein, partial [Candidatus Methylomirabilis sp.]|nr:lysylphosphatidylglycerol synthase domain-containing protein [Deltaproteobacteria bacterium]
SNLMMAVTDSLVFVTFIGSALLFGGERVDAIWKLLCAGLALGHGTFFSYWYTDLRNRILPRFEREGLLRSMSRARPSHWTKLYGARFVMMSANVVGNYVALRAFDVDVPFSVTLWAMPLVLGTAFLPISVGGFGGPQAAAIYFFRAYGTEEAIVACSLLWSTAFLLGRLGLGFLFFRQMWRGAFGEK